MSDRDGRKDGAPRRAKDGEERELSERLHNLDRRLDENRAARAEAVPKEPAADRPGMAMALRLGADFVAGVVIGAALGWGVDKLFGTSPWGLVVFLMLGFAAGVLSVLRSAGLVKPGPAVGDDISRRGK